MPGKAQPQAGEADGNTVWLDIGRGLTRMYDAYLRSPMPEQLLALVAQLDAREQHGISSGSPDKGATAK
jgi:hypothetical protein